jgi:flagellar hook-associated protein 2
MATNGIDLSISGLATGFDWKTVVSQLAQAERAPEILWRTNQAIINNKNTAFGRIKTFLDAIQTDVQALKDPTLFASRTASTSDSAIATAFAGASSTLGSFTFNITQLATSAKITGTSDVGKAIAPDGDLTAITVGTAGFATSVNAGTFTINGKQITIATTDTLQQVFDKIATGTSNAVTASYDSGTDKITLSSGSEIILGSATDTSNFLQVAQLYNNGTGAITSAASLGRVRLTDKLSSASTQTAISDGGSGAGKFTINGVEINYNATADSVQDVLARINNSTAGVAASYDSQNDRFVLTNKNTGDVGIALQDNTGNFLAATGLTAGTFAHGKNLLYTLNGDPQQLVSTSNTISSDSSNITGLSVTAIDEGSVTISVGSDTSKIKTAIQNFVKDYNTAQSYITTQTASSTDSNGKVTAGILAGDLDASKIASSLRSLSFAPISGLTGTIDQLAKLGVKTNGKDNTIVLDDAALDAALANSLSSVQSLFSDATNGLAGKLDTYFTNTIGDDGSLTKHQTALTKQSSSIDAQITSQEKIIATDAAQWTKAFQQMEAAQAQINQQMAYLTQQINNGTL